MLTDIESEVTPKKNEHPTMRRMYAITDITASVSDATGNENKLQASNGEYIPSQPETEDQVHDEDLYGDNPTLKKKQKKTKAPIREVINANCKEHHPHKEEDRVSHWIVS